MELVRKQCKSDLFSELGYTVHKTGLMDSFTNQTASALKLLYDSVAAVTNLLKIMTLR